MGVLRWNRRRLFLVLLFPLEILLTEGLLLRSTIAKCQIRMHRFFPDKGDMILTSESAIPGLNRGQPIASILCRFGGRWTPLAILRMKHNACVRDRNSIHGDLPRYGHR